MKSSNVRRFFKKLMRLPQHLGIGFGHALVANGRMLSARLRGKRTMVVCIAEVHLIHVESTLRLLRDRGASEWVELIILTDMGCIATLGRKLATMGIDARVFSALSVRFLVFCDFMLSVWQGQVYPYFGCRIRACSYHGQPSKGNTYEGFNYRQINVLFFYGPLMRDYYLKNKRENPHWPEIPWYEIGQPLSDRLFQGRIDRKAAREKLGLDAGRLTVIYAPSFEYCSSIATHGPEIIDALLSMDINLIVKPHPAFYFAERFDKDRDGPIVGEWRDRMRGYNANPRCIFPEEGGLDSALALAASDIMLTDYSGIAFDGILSDLGMIYWNCPLLYSEYLPSRFGISAESARSDLACNVGRDAGIVVNDIHELGKAVRAYGERPDHNGEKREAIRSRLLFNHGKATEAMVDKIEELLMVRRNDRG